MMRMTLAMVATAAALWAQTAAGPAGHWEGAIQTPNGDLKIEIDLAQQGGGWMGTISIPMQNTRGLVLNDLTVKDSAVSFRLKAPGDPLFTATVDKEGTKLAGELQQGGANMPFQLTRTGEAKIEKPVVNAPLGKELEGTWEGALDVNGRQLRLRFLLANEPGGGAKGTTISLDQGNSEIPIGRITQSGAKVKLEVPVVNGAFEGELKETQIAGQWSQGGGTLPLTLTKASK